MVELPERTQHIYQTSTVGRSLDETLVKIHVIRHIIGQLGLTAAMPLASG
jgi:hypothetical protein